MHSEGKKNIVIENIQAPVAKAIPTVKQQEQPTQISQPKLPKNDIDLDSDIDYSHPNVHSIINGYVSFTRANENNTNNRSTEVCYRAGSDASMGGGAAAVSDSATNKSTGAANIASLIRLQ